MADERPPEPTSSEAGEAQKPAVTRGQGEEAAEGGGEQRLPENPATPVEKRFVALFLFVVTVVLLLVTWWTVQRMDRPWRAEIQVQWIMPVGVSLKPGPVSFWHDRESHLLIYRGPVSESIKGELLELIQLGNGDIDEVKRNGQTGTSSSEGTRGSEDAAGNADIESYWAAINELTFQANRSLRSSSHWLPILGGLGGMIGAQARSIWIFIWIACFKNILDVKRWWPWYVMRPVLGFIVGAVLVVLIKGELFDPTQAASQAQDPTWWWWLGLSFLVGFVAREFLGRLRKMIEALFGITVSEETEVEKLPAA